LGSRAHAQPVHLVTQARRPKSEDISYRQRRYLLMMGVRAACFVVAMVMFVNHLGWLAAIPIVGAIIIPYFAVVFANGGREPDNTRGFLEYQTRLPARRDDDLRQGSPGAPGAPDSGDQP
jgi:Protein of unknown function (DUF3099)